MEPTGAQAVYSISLIAAFVAGMIALFAPCCLSYLLPAYLGNVFKERRQVIFMTLVYSLGIFTVMLPVVLGAKVLADWFFTVHDQTFFLGGVFLLAVALISFLGLKLPMPHFRPAKAENDVLSTFVLGIFSGITSACCAPVLIGVITLSSLTPSLLQSLGVAMMYVLGMVAPLYLAAAFIHRKNLLEQPILRRHLTTLTLAGRAFPILVSNVAAGAIFAFTGFLIIGLTFAGKLNMADQSAVTQMINRVAVQVSALTDRVPGISLVLTALVLYLFYRWLQLDRSKNDSHDRSSCCEELTEASEKDRLNSNKRRNP